MHATYLNALTPQRFNDTVKAICETIINRFPDCNMVASRGFSGGMIVPAVAAFLGVEWALARKSTTDNHSGYSAEVSRFPEDGAKIVFVDDLIDSGATLRETVVSVRKQVTRFYSAAKANAVEWIGVVCYESLCGTRFAIDDEGYKKIPGFLTGDED